MTRVVCIGGGHGMAVTLRAVSTYADADAVVGIVTVADDGGSTGRLRALTGLPAMGDIRRCLSSLADPAVPLGQLFEHRFDPDADSVEGHALGNLLIAAAAQRTGDFVGAIDYFRTLLGVRATVLPATAEPVVLVGEGECGEVRGQARIKADGGVTRVRLDPVAPPPVPGAVDAIAAADQVVLGPGSLFTSVLAALAVPAIADAVAATRARVVYVANLCDEAETKGLDVDGHLGALATVGVEPASVVPPTPRLATGSGRTHDVEALARALADLA